MPPVATINEAIANCNNKATISNQSGTLGATFAAWNAAWGIVPTQATEAQRTVRNWYVGSLVVQNSAPAPAVIGTIQQVQDIVNVTCRVLYATRAAAAATPARITAGQQTAILAAYNASYGAF